MGMDFNHKEMTSYRGMTSEWTVVNAYGLCMRCCCTRFGIFAEGFHLTLRPAKIGTYRKTTLLHRRKKRFIVLAIDMARRNGAELIWSQ